MLFLDAYGKMEKGLPNRWLEVLIGLREGRSTAQQFSKYLVSIGERPETRY